MTSGTYKIFLQSGSTQIQSPDDLTILAPIVNSVSPNHGAAGTAVVISGEGFGNSVSNVNVRFGGSYANLSSVNNNQINAVVPTILGNGVWALTVTIGNYSITNNLTFSVP